jgi:transcriptional regulator GlxA family with amidase domain
MDMKIQNKIIKCAFLIPENAWLSTALIHAEVYTALDSFEQTTYGPEYSSFDITYLHLPNKQAKSFSKLNIESEEISDQIYDMIIIATVWRPNAQEIKQQTSTLKWLRCQHENGATIIGLITGQYYMAAAGLLDGKDATVHCSYANLFKHHFPKVKLNTKMTISETNNLICTTGMRASLEVMMMNVERYCGKETAELCAKHYEFTEPERFGKPSLESNKSDIIVDAAKEEISLHYHTHLTLNSLAEKLNVSPRSLSRKFQCVTGNTTMQYVQKQRLQLAKRLLANSSESIEQIAQKVGFNSASVLGRKFKAHFDKSPLQYRKFIMSNLD